MRDKTRERGAYQFIQHDQQADSGEIHRVAWTGHDEFADALGLESRPPCAAADAIWGRSAGERERAVDDGDVGEGLGRNVIEAPADFGLERRL